MGRKVFILIMVAASIHSSFALSGAWVEAESEMDLELRWIGYLEDSPKGKDNFGQTRLKPELTLAFNRFPDLSLIIEGDFRLDNENLASGAIDGKTEDHGRWSVNIRQAYLEYFYQNYRVSIGKKVFDWSVADTVSPIDNLSPRDWTLVPEPERIAIPALNLEHDTTGGFIQLVLAPWFTPSKLPRGRWREDLPGRVSRINLIDNSARIQFAVRVNQLWRGFDLTGSFYDGVSYNPYGRINPASFVPAMELRYSDQRVLGGALVKEMAGGYILKAEAGYFDQEAGDDFFQYIAGVQKEFFAVFGSVDTLVCLVQYTNEKVTSEADKSVIEVTDFRRLFKDSFLWRFSYDPGGGSPWKFELEGTYSLFDSGSFIRPKILFRKDKWCIEGGVQWVGGPRDSFWGRYDNDALFINFNYFFR